MAVTQNSVRPPFGKIISLINRHTNNIGRVILRENHQFYPLSFFKPRGFAAAHCLRRIGSLAENVTGGHLGKHADRGIAAA